MDGGHGTSGPGSFKGPLGQAVSGDIHRQPVAQFRPIPSSLQDMPVEVAADLSSDQRLMHRYSQAVSAGTVDAELTRVPNSGP